MMRRLGKPCGFHLFTAAAACGILCLSLQLHHGSAAALDVKFNSEHRALDNSGAEAQLPSQRCQAGGDACKGVPGAATTTSIEIALGDGEDRLSRLATKTTSKPTPAPSPKPTATSTTAKPSVSPTTRSPTTAKPSAAPSLSPTRLPTAAPTQAPTRAPTSKPSFAPTRSPTATPTHAPTSSPTHTPTRAPTSSPTVSPTPAPTAYRTASSLGVGHAEGHTCVILSDGTVRCFGLNDYGQLGLGHTRNIGDNSGEMGSALAITDIGTGKTAEAIALGYDHTCVLRNDASVVCFGRNGDGQLGLGHTLTIGDGSGEMGDNLSSADLGSGRTATAIAAGGSHMCAILDDGTIKCWGFNYHGQLGLGDSNNRGDDTGEMGTALSTVNLGTGITAIGIAAGSNHTCALLNDNHVKCWGQGWYGQLGNGNSSDIGDDSDEMGSYLSAISLWSNNTATAIACGFWHTCAILDNTDLKCWGLSVEGDLGRRTSSSTSSTSSSTSSSPYGFIGDEPFEMGDNRTAISLGTNRTASEVTAGGYDTCVLLDDGSVVCFGLNALGELGIGAASENWSNSGAGNWSDSGVGNWSDSTAGNWSDSKSSVGGHRGDMGDALIAVELGIGLTATSISAGQYHVCALLSDKSVKCWGDNEYGQCGQGTEANIGDGVVSSSMGNDLPAVALVTSAAPTRAPTPVPSAAPSKAPTQSPTRLPTSAPSTAPTKSPTASPTHAPTSSPTTAKPSAAPSKAPTQSPTQLPTSKPSSAPSAAPSKAPTQSPTRLPTSAAPSKAPTQSPTQLPTSTPSAAPSKSPTASPTHSPSSSSPTHAPSRAPTSSPTSAPTASPTTASTVTASSLGVGQAEGHTCVILSDGTVRCFGLNNYGQLGLGHTRNIGDNSGEMGSALATSDIGTGKTAEAIALGYDHTYVLRSDASVVCFGRNLEGQLGVGHTSTLGDGTDEMGDNLSSTNLGTDRTATAIAAGGSHTCAILDDATIKCWGYNLYGQLGLGDSNNRGDDTGEMGMALSTVDLGTGKTAIGIAAGSNHTCALLNDYTIKCWGQGWYGQLGNGNSTDIGDDIDEMGSYLSAVSLGTSRTATAIACGAYHTCAILDNTNLKCWGDEEYGQLGQGTWSWSGVGASSGEMGDDLAAINLGTSRYATQVSPGGYMTCVLRDTSTVVCFGRDNYGQLGIGSTTTVGDDSGEMGSALSAIGLGTGVTVQSIAAGAEHVCAVLSDQTLKCWGRNDYGQCGQGTTDAIGDNSGEMGSSLSAVALTSSVTSSSVSTSNSKRATIIGVVVACAAIAVVGITVMWAIKTRGSRGDDKEVDAMESDPAAPGAAVAAQYTDAADGVDKEENDCDGNITREPEDVVVDEGGDADNDPQDIHPEEP